MCAGSRNMERDRQKIKTKKEPISFWRMNPPLPPPQHIHSWFFLSLYLSPTTSSSDLSTHFFAVCRVSRRQNKNCVIFPIRWFLFFFISTRFVPFTRSNYIISVCMSGTTKEKKNDSVFHDLLISINLLIIFVDIIDVFHKRQYRKRNQLDINCYVR